MRFTLFFDVRHGGTRYRWRLGTSEGETVYWSTKAYAQKSECKADIEFMKKSYPAIPVVELTVARI
jgi:uncharacterized protein YegP (UPF0339 family)